ncbi:MAG TPA: cysteine peptidase family C39 domain-containing protein, partial [Candidatus Methylacidiphilales bacterium]|nr:cysteine peptidase family C39 domain-containing protein [Candidatus Methylacidiphilales bacterium]
MMLNAPPVLAQVQTEIDTAKQSPGPTYPAPVTTPTHVKVNRQLPSFTPPSTSLSFSDHPTDQEIFTYSLFAEPLVPIGGKTTRTENAELAKALLIFSQRKVRDDYRALEDFLATHPQSAWRISLLTDLGWLYRQTGWYSKSLTVWEQAWALGKNETAPRAKAIVDRALSELVVLNARIGRIERLGPLFKEIQGRVMVGSSREKIEAAKQGYNKMVTEPKEGYRCGPQALETLRQHWDKPVPFSKLINTEPSTAQGTSLTQIYHLAQKISLDLIMAKRTPGSAVLVPSVVNWKVGHFAAIIGQDKGLIHLHDTTFGDDVSISPQALDAESSGYFLVKNQPLPPGWSPVSEEEGKTVWGKGPSATVNTNDNKKGPTDGCPGGSGDSGDSGDSGGSANMAVYSIYDAVGSLSLDDTPLHYKPAYGPPVDFTVSYSEREMNQPSVFTYSNLGPLWTFNWLSYITEVNAGVTVNQYLSGGGTTSYTGYNGTINAYAPDVDTGAVLKYINSSTSDSATSNIYELDMADGSKQIFGLANTATPRQVFLTRTVDPQGNALVYYYDSNYRMTSVKDATGLVTTIAYGSTSSSSPAFYQIATVTDPFSRTATLAYTADGDLASSTDMIGIASHYNYVEQVLVSLQTPYGTTTFDTGQDSDKRWVQINDPQGGQQRLETWTGANSSVPDSASPLPAPTGVNNTYLNDRNAFFWDRKAMLVCAGTLDYTKAKITHLLHDSVTEMSDVVEGIKQPLESRVYYNYPNQASNGADLNFIGTDNFPIRITRILDNSDTQETDLTHNSLGKTTQVTDPAGRVTNYTYASNNIDLTEVTQVNGSNNDVLFAATYNSQHEPLTTTDASGRTTTYTYYSTGQIETVTDALSETTTYAYNSDGQLTSITGPATGATVSLTYDGYGRIRTTTDLNGYVKTYDYDALNRVTQITHPDSTTDQFVYTTLDVTLRKDRQNRWTRYLYNALGALIGTADPQGRVTTYERCTCGALVGLVDPLGHRTSWVYDLESRPTSKSFADGSGYAYVYDTNYTSRLMSVTDPKSQVTSYSYNDDNTPSEAAYADSTVAYTYDSVYPRLTGATKTITATSASYPTALTYN